MTSVMRTNLPKPYIFLLLAFATALLTGCRGWRLVRSESERKLDSVIIRTEYRERIDTAYITIEKWFQQVLADTTSTLENKYCISRAEITAMGMLYHTLETKPQQFPVPVTTTEKVRDSVIYREKEVKVREPYPVERELTRWQKFRLQGFWYMLAALVLAVIWICRKPLIKIFLRIVGK